jgi:predicted metalloprotease with PDZ domain
VIRARSLPVALVLTLGLCAAAAAEPAVRYRVSLDEASRARGGVGVTVEIAAAPSPLELAFPAWLPGAYELRFFGRDASAIEAVDDHGRVLRVDRDGPGRVRITGHSAGARVRVRYHMGAELLSDDGADVGREHAYLNPGAIVPMVRGLEARPHALELEALPRGWRALSASMPEDGPPRIEGADYLALIDQPIEAVDAEVLVQSEVRAAGGRFRIVVHTDAGTRERARKLLPTIARDLGRIAEAERALAGPLPFDRYLVVMHLTERATRLAGLEHAAATSVVATPRLIGAEDYPELMHVLSHELFHAWNARRLIPAELIVPSLEQPQPSASLWITEGLTEHVALVALGRAGLLTRGELSAALEETLSRARYAERAGVSLESLARMAFAAPSALAADPDAYYAVGHVVSLAVVAALLERSHGKLGLEELLAAILPPPDGAPRAIDTAALGRALDRLAPGPAPLSAQLQSWVEQPFSLAALLPSLAAIGFVTEQKVLSRLDVAVLADGEPPILRLLEPGGAFVRAGALRGDQLVRIDGVPAHLPALQQLPRAPTPSAIAVEVLRGGESLSLRLEPRRVDDVAVKLAPTVLGKGPRDGAVLARLLGGLPRH